MTERQDRNFSRRGFIKATAIGVGATALGGVATMREAEAVGARMKWDQEADTVVVGYGGAGAAAAIMAHDGGSKVLIVEKAAEGGGSTMYSGGFFVSPRDVQGTVNYLLECSRAGDGRFFDVDEKSLTAWAEEAVKNEPWITSLGGEVFVSLKGWFDAEGAASYTSCQVKPNTTGVGLWKVLADAVETRKIPVIYEIAGSELVTRELVAADGTQCVEVLGIIAEKAGRRMAIKAKKGVVLTCGGFDYDETMKKNYLRAYPVHSMGHLGNTGDAIKLAAKTGADLWHTNCAPCALCHKFDEVPVAYPSLIQLMAMALPLIIVNKLGKRFTNEEQPYDMVGRAMENFDTVKRDYSNIPCWCVFDEEARTKGPVGLPVPIGNPKYTWSPDNTEEIDKGWILKADAIKALAEKMGVDPAALEQTVTTFNRYCAEEEDPEFGRSVGLKPIAKAPFYAVKGYPGTWGTAGGPRINTKAQVVDVKGERVRRLYAAGNASAFAVAYLYPLSGTLIGDAFAMGRIAGRNVSGETVW